MSMFLPPEVLKVLCVAPSCPAFPAEMTPGTSETSWSAFSAVERQLFDASAVDKL
jgi:hypothetical protein